MMVGLGRGRCELFGAHWEIREGAQNRNGSWEGVMLFWFATWSWEYWMCFELSEFVFESLFSFVHAHVLLLSY